MILKHFLLPIDIQASRILNENKSKFLFPNEKIYDIFYHPEKQKKIQILLGETTNEELSKKLFDLFWESKLLLPSAKYHLLSSINEFFAHEIIEKTKTKIQFEFLKKHSSFASDARKLKRKEKNQNIIKKISKLTGRKQCSIASIAKKTSIPYHQVRQVIKELQQTKFDIQSEKKDIDEQKDKIQSLETFQKVFPNFQDKNLTVSQMFKRLQTKFPFFENISRSHFYVNFLKRQGYVYVKPKLKHSLFQTAKKSQSRVLTTFLIYSVIKSKQFLMFYDETTIQMTKSGHYSWFHRTEAKERQIRVTNTFLKLNVIMTMDRLIAFTLSFEPFRSTAVQTFITTTCNHVFKHEAKDQDIYLVLDNAPKNRSKTLTEDCKNGVFRLIMTTPTTPQHNFAESIFHFVKKQIDRREFNTFEKAYKESQVEMSKKLLDVLENLTEENFGDARKMNLHDLQTTLNI